MLASEGCRVDLVPTKRGSVRPESLTLLRPGLGVRAALRIVLGA
jgi:hypothetical protein